MCEENYIITQKNSTILRIHNHVSTISNFALWFILKEMRLPRLWHKKQPLLESNLLIMCFKKCILNQAFKEFD